MDTTSTTFPGFVTGGSSYSSGSGAITSVPYPSNSGSSSVSSAFGISSIAGTLVQVLVLMAMVGLVGVVVIAVVASRSEPDPTGRRPQSVYYFVVSFVTLAITIFGSALVVGSIVLLTSSLSDGASHALDRLLLFSLLVTVVGGVLFFGHLRRGLALARIEDGATSPSKRVGQTYVSLVSFVAVLVFLVSVIVSLYVLFAVIAPGTFGSFGGRSWSIRILVESVYLVAISAIVASWHGGMLDPPLRPWSRRTPDGRPTYGFATVPPPVDPSAGAAPPSGL